MKKNIDARDRIEVVQADLATLEVDAIVHAVSTNLLGGGDENGDLHRVAGPELLEACKKHAGCKEGYAKITEAYDLPAKYVIHAVSPSWSGGGKREKKILASAYRESLKLASKRGVSTIAFPVIGCGRCSFPHMFACQIAVSEVTAFLSENDTIKKVVFVCENAGVEEKLNDALKAGGQYVDASDLWFKLEGMIQQRWALIEGDKDSAVVRFYDAGGLLIDCLKFDSFKRAKAGLLYNGFLKYLDPKAGFKKQALALDVVQQEEESPCAKAYSSGENWKA